MRLIDADKINFNEVFMGASDFARDTREAAQSLIDAQPTIEAVPVVHGEWIQRIDAPDTWDCSNCGTDICLEDDLQTPHDAGLDFCPKCGAMMKGGENE